jgi:hypothetical protein
MQEVKIQISKMIFAINIVNTVNMMYRPETGAFYLGFYNLSNETPPSGAVQEMCTAARSAVHFT